MSPAMRGPSPQAVGLPAGYEVVSGGGLRALHRNGECVSVFAADAPAGAIAQTAVRDAAHREGISSRDLHITLGVLAGDGIDELARHWGLLPEQIASIAAGVCARLWPTTTIEEVRS